MFEKLRIKIIHKLKGLTLEEAQKPKHIEFKSFTAVPEKVTAKMILHAGREYAPAVVQQRLSRRRIRPSASDPPESKPSESTMSSYCVSLNPYDSASSGIKTCGMKNLRI